MLGWVFSVCLHEYGHAVVAYYGGDTSVEEKGYLSLNPLRYGHPVMSLVLPLVYLMMGGFGLPGGAVYIEESRIRSKAWLAAVSIAGPAMNVMLAALLWIPLRFSLVSQPRTACWPLPLTFSRLFGDHRRSFSNLLPIPPLGRVQLRPPLAADAKCGIG